MDCYDALEKQQIRFEYIQAVEHKSASSNMNNQNESETQIKSQPRLLRVKPNGNQKVKKKKNKVIAKIPAKTSKEIYDFISFN